MHSSSACSVRAYKSTALIPRRSSSFAMVVASMFSDASVIPVSSRSDSRWGLFTARRSVSSSSSMRFFSSARRRCSLVASSSDAFICSATSRSDASRFRTSSTSSFFLCVISVHQANSISSCSWSFNACCECAFSSSSDTSDATSFCCAASSLDRNAFSYA